MNEKKKHKRRGIIMTSIYHALMLVIFIFFGLTYQDPPPEEGIAINFGYEETGSGNTTQAPKESVPQPTQPEPQPQEIEEVVTQDVEDAPAVTKEKTKKDPVKNPEEKTTEKPKETPPDPQPTNRLNNALKSTKNSEDATGKGEGVTEGGGDQGDRDGDINSQNRTGGGAGNGNYNLNGRSALQKPKPKYDCEEQGRVVVRVRVNRNGKTISAEPGVSTSAVKTNTTSSCLLKRAKEAAMRTTWSAKQSAVEMQTGYIIYNFSKR